MTITKDTKQTTYDVRFVSWKIKSIRQKISRIENSIQSMGNFMQYENQTQCWLILKDIEEAKNEKEALKMDLRDLLARRHPAAGV